MASTRLTVAVGKAVRAAARLRGGGTALPGRVVEKMDPGFMARALGQLPCGVVLVSGTNGKTTTTRIVASLLSGMGLKVFTNPTGSNFTRGVVSALIDAVDARGRLDADVAVLELDEAYAVRFVKAFAPRYALLLNVMRDQLDRFGEIDTTARMLGAVARRTTGTVVLNREDPRVAALAKETRKGTGGGARRDDRACADVTRKGAKVAYFGLDASLRGFFPSDDHMHDAEAGGANVTDTHFPDADVTLLKADGHDAEFAMDGRRMATRVRLEGVYNLYNAAAALAAARAVLRDVRGGELKPDDDDRLIGALSTVTPAFGRGETITYKGAPVELFLVKNPMGFRLSLASFSPKGCDTMIVINDEYADGRDMSWLWDVDFTSLAEGGVAMVSGTRATDMALRLAYDGVKAEKVEEGIAPAVDAFLAATPGKPKHIYCTYTAMLAVRKHLAAVTSVKDAGL